MDRRGPTVGGLFWTAVWLFPLLGPVGTIGKTARPAAVAGGALALFCVLYVGVVWSGFDHFGPRWFRIGGLVVVGALAVALPLAYDASWLLLMLYATTACAATFSDTPRPVFGIALVALGCLTILTIGLVRHIDAGTYLSIVLGTALSCTVVFVIRQMTRLIRELQQTREQLAVAAVAEERLRFSRDLHDLLGHTLSLVVVKAEVVRRLAERDPAAAAAQAADIEQVGRRALVEIREAVTGYREAGLTAELSRARSALGAAGVEVFVRRTAQSLPQPTDALLAWVVREAVTNVVRHSRARECEIVLGTDDGVVTLSISDDGTGPGDTAPGNGLRGLDERLAAAGGELRTGVRDGGGFTLVASLPVAAS